MIGMLTYKHAHMELLYPRQQDLDRYSDNIKEFMTNPLADIGFSFTAVCDGRVLVVGGIVPATPRTAFGWTVVGKYAALHGLAVVKAVKRQLENIMEDCQIHRVETSNMVDAHDHNQWCRLLGFREEGTLWQYDDQKRDYIRFAKILNGGS